MIDGKRFEILDSLPAYGPMFIPVTESGIPYYSEGFVVRFFKSDGTSWVANFQPGYGRLDGVFEFPVHNRMIVIARGQCYVMSSESDKPLLVFGPDIQDAFQVDHDLFVCLDNTSVVMLRFPDVDIWTSERISWDGFRYIKFENNIISGQSYEPTPTDSMNGWSDFTFAIDTKEIKGGSYKAGIESNAGIFGYNYTHENGKKHWWEIWM